MSIRSKAEENILAAMIIAGLEQGVFGLGVGETYKFDDEDRSGKYGYYDFEYCGLTFRTRTIMYDEEIGLHCCVPKKIALNECHPSAVMRARDVRVLAGGWLGRERRSCVSLRTFSCERELAKTFARAGIAHGEYSFLVSHIVPKL
jgi:hypothetical protein